MTDVKDYVVPCSCHGFHFLRVTSWPEDDNDPMILAETYLSIGGDFWHSWKDRIKGAWHVLSGRHAHSCEVLLDRAGAIQLRNVLEEHLHLIGYELPPNPPRPAFPPRQDDNFGLYDHDVPVTVCVTHKRFVPCRNTEGCVLSSRDDDVEQVRAYQSGE